MVWHQIIIFIPCDWIPNGDRSEDPIQNIQAVGPRPSNSLHRTTSRTQTLDRVVSKIVDGVQTAIQQPEKDLGLTNITNIPNTPGDYN